MILGLGGVLWAPAGFVLAAVWFVLVFRALVGILASDLSGGRKVAWFCFVGFFPLVGAIVYLVRHVKPVAGTAESA